MVVFRRGFFRAYFFVRGLACHRPSTRPCLGRWPLPGSSDKPGPHLPPLLCLGRRFARRDGPYPALASRHRGNDAFAATSPVRPATPAPRRPRYVITVRYAGWRLPASMDRRRQRWAGPQTEPARMARGRVPGGLRPGALPRVIAGLLTRESEYKNIFSSECCRGAVSAPVRRLTILLWW